MKRYFSTLGLFFYITCSGFCSVPNDSWNEADESAYREYIRLVEEVAKVRLDFIADFLKEASVPDNTSFTPPHVYYSHQMQVGGTSPIEVFCDPLTESGRDLLLQALSDLRVNQADLYGFTLHMQHLLALEKTLKKNVKNYFDTTKLPLYLPMLTNLTGVVDITEFKAEGILLAHIRKEEEKKKKGEKCTDDPYRKDTHMSEHSNATFDTNMESFSRLDLSAQDNTAWWCAELYYLRHRVVVQMAEDLDPQFKQVLSSSVYSNLLNQYELNLQRRENRFDGLMHGWMREIELFLTQYETIPLDKLYGYFWNFVVLRENARLDYFKKIFASGQVSSIPLDVINMVDYFKVGDDVRISTTYKEGMYQIRKKSYMDFFEKHQVTHKELIPYFMELVCEYFMTHMFIDAFSNVAFEKRLFSILNDESKEGLNRTLIRTRKLSDELEQIFLSFVARSFMDANPFFIDDKKTPGQPEPTSRLDLRTGYAFDAREEDVSKMSDDVRDIVLKFRLMDRMSKMYMLRDGRTVAKLLSASESKKIQELREEANALLGESPIERPEPTIIIKANIGTISGESTRVEKAKERARLKLAKKKSRQKERDQEKKEPVKADLEVQPEVNKVVTPSLTSPLPEVRKKAGTPLTQKMDEGSLILLEGFNLTDWADTDSVEIDVLIEDIAKAASLIQTLKRNLVNILLQLKGGTYSFAEDQNWHLVCYDEACGKAIYGTKMYRSVLELNPNASGTPPLSWAASRGEVGSTLKNLVESKEETVGHMLAVRDRLLANIFLLTMLNKASITKDLDLMDEPVDLKGDQAEKSYFQSLSFLDMAYGGLFVQYLKDMQKPNMAARLQKRTIDTSQLNLYFEGFDFDYRVGLQGKLKPIESENKLRTTFHFLASQAIRKMVCPEFPVMVDVLLEVRGRSIQEEGDQSFPTRDDWWAISDCILRDKQALQGKLEATRNTLQQSIHKLKTANDHAKSLEEKCEVLEKDRLSALTLLEDYSKKLTSQAKAIAEHRKEIESHAKEVKDAQKKINSLSSVQKENKRLQAKLESAEQQKSELESLMAELESNQEENKRLLDELEVVEGQKNELDSLLTKLTSENDKTKEQNENLSMLMQTFEKQVGQIQKDHEEIQKEYALTTEKMKGIFQETKSKLTRAEEQVQSLKKQLDMLQQDSQTEKDALQARMQGVKELNAQISVKLIQRQTELEQTKAEIEYKETHLTALRQEVDGLIADVAVCQAENGILKVLAEQRGEELQCANIENQRLMAENARMMAQLQALHNSPVKVETVEQYKSEEAFELMQAKKTIAVLHESLDMWKGMAISWKDYAEALNLNPFLIQGANTIKDNEGRSYTLTLEQQFNLAMLVVKAGCMGDKEIQDVVYGAQKDKSSM